MPLRACVVQEGGAQIEFNSFFEKSGDYRILGKRTVPALSVGERQTKRQSRGCLRVLAGAQKGNYSGDS